MTRMADRVFNGTMEPPYWLSAPAAASTIQEAHRALKGALLEAEVIAGDEVGEYMYGVTDQEDWDVYTDFPCLAPPFPLFWVELRRPSRVISSRLGECDPKGLPYAWGFLFQAEEVDGRELVAKDAENFSKGKKELEDAVVEGWERLGEVIQAKQVAHPDKQEFLESLTEEERKLLKTAHVLNTVYEGADDGLASLAEERLKTKWRLTANLYIESEKGLIQGPFVRWFFPIAADGTVAGKGVYHPWEIGEERTLPELEVHEIATLIYPALLTLSFLNCKNVKLVVNQPPLKLSRAHEKRHGRPLLRFHTLQIQPMREILSREGRVEETGLKRALHICRGHFKDYRDKGLFGRFRNVYWWDAHVRGTIREGAVLKDYQVSGPVQGK